MKIKKIVKVDELYDVYNMEVEKSHCFSATNSHIIIHNCMDAIRYGINWINRNRELNGVARNIGI